MSKSEWRRTHSPALTSRTVATYIHDKAMTINNASHARPHRYKLMVYKRERMNRFGSDMKKYNRTPNLTAWAGKIDYLDPKYFLSLENKALDGVNSQLRVASSFWEDWYERKQSYALIAKSAKALLNFARNFKSPRYWQHLAKDRRPADLPSAWLAYQFGVKPLIGSIDRGMNLLGSDFPVMNISKTSGANFEVATGQPLVLSQFGYNVGHATLKIRYKLGCRVVGINPNQALSGALGLGEPFSSSWSVLPWGWAVDYIANVGQLLSNLEDNHPGIIVADWYETRVVRCTAHCETDHNKTSAINRERLSFSADMTVFHMERIPLTSKPKFQLEFKYPKLGGNQAANLMSALALTLKGKK